MNHDPFKINEAILDMWRDLKAGDDYIERLEVRNAELVSENARLKAEVERLTKDHSDALADFWPFYKGYFDLKAEVERLRKEGKPSETKSPSFIEDLGNGVEKHDLLFRYPAKEGKPSV